jgi:hypothetical protein
MSTIKVNKLYSQRDINKELGNQQKERHKDIIERENNVKLRAIKDAERIIKNAIKNKKLDPEFIQTQEQFKNDYIKKYLDIMYDMDNFINKIEERDIKEN